MSTVPWGTMNGWLRTEGEQRGAWLSRRVQDVRAARVAPAEPVTRQALRPIAAGELAEPIPLKRGTAKPATPSAAQPCTDVA